MIAAFGGRDTFLIHQVDIQIFTCLGFVFIFLNLNFARKSVFIQSFTSERKVLLLLSLVASNRPRWACLVICPRSLNRLMYHG